jgi:cellulase/cellobiase CelA1
MDSTWWHDIVITLIRNLKGPQVVAVASSSSSSSAPSCTETCTPAEYSLEHLCHALAQIPSLTLPTTYERTLRETLAQCVQSNELLCRKTDNGKHVYRWNHQYIEPSSQLTSRKRKRPDTTMALSSNKRSKSDSTTSSVARTISSSTTTCTTTTSSAPEHVERECHHLLLLPPELLRYIFHFLPHWQIVTCLRLVRTVAM